MIFFQMTDTSICTILAELNLQNIIPVLRKHIKLLNNLPNRCSYIHLQIKGYNYRVGYLSQFLYNHMVYQYENIK